MAVGNHSWHLVSDGTATTVVDGWVVVVVLVALVVVVVNSTARSICCWGVRSCNVIVALGAMVRLAVVSCTPVIAHNAHSAYVVIAIIASRLRFI